MTFDDVRVDALTAGRKSMVARLGDDQFNMKEFKTGSRSTTVTGSSPRS